MNNTVCLIGRITNDLELKELDNEKKVTNFTLAIPRTYKNSEGIYETDFIDCSLWNNMAQNTIDYCKKGDLIAIRGRLNTDVYEKNDQTYKSIKVVAEKVSFLSSKEQNKTDQNRDEKVDKYENIKSII